MGHSKAGNGGRDGEMEEERRKRGKEDRKRSALVRIWGSVGVRQLREQDKEKRQLQLLECTDLGQS